MACRYNACVPNRQPSLPDLWLVTDERNNARLDTILAQMPRGSGVIFRHYHLKGTARLRRFAEVRRTAQRHGHIVILSGTPREAECRGADGAYGPSQRLTPRAEALRLATAHSAREIAAANRAGADAILLSPVFATRSHPGAATLGPVRFRLLARLAKSPVIALGGMSARRARHLKWKKWAAIDGI
ncbi:MAG: thiamine phosphate synthase [Novosphingobium sp.]|nr:thiamine phosphate synthase [Novosphingobium sp.]